MSYLNAFQQYTNCNGSLCLQTYPTFENSTPSETLIIKEIISHLGRTIQCLDNSHMPIIYKWIAVNYSLALIVCPNYIRSFQS
jgi:hypothetical protein